MFLSSTFHFSTFIFSYCFNAQAVYMGTAVYKSSLYSKSLFFPPNYTGWKAIPTALCIELFKTRLKHISRDCSPGGDNLWEPTLVEQYYFQEDENLWFKLIYMEISTP